MIINDGDIVSVILVRTGREAVGEAKLNRIYHHIFSLINHTGDWTYDSCMFRDRGGYNGRDSIVERLV